MFLMEIRRKVTLTKIHLLLHSYNSRMCLGKMKKIWFMMDWYNLIQCTILNRILLFLLSLSRKFKIWMNNPLEKMKENWFKMDWYNWIQCTIINRNHLHLAWKFKNRTNSLKIFNNLTKLKPRKSLKKHLWNIRLRMLNNNRNLIESA